MHRIYILVTALPAICGLLMIGACLSQEPAPEPFAIAWNYDTSGYLETCGCSAHQLGGLAKRATLLDELREKQPVLAIEGAHVVEDAGEFQLFKGVTVARSLGVMGYDAMMLGFREAQHGATGLDQLVSAAQFPCFSANLQIDDEPWPTPSVEVKIAGVVVNITGVSDHKAVSFELPAEISFSDPAVALDVILADFNSQAGLSVVCLEGGASWIDQMLANYADRVNLFLTGDRAEATANLEFDADPPKLNNWDHGRNLGLVMVDPLPTGFSFSGSSYPVADTITDAEVITTLLEQQYRPRLPDFLPIAKEQLGELHMPPDYCKDCHAEAYEAYIASSHSHALQTLHDRGQLYNPDCMGCHLAYDVDNDELVSMNCVTCHSNITVQHVYDVMKGEYKLPAEPVTANRYEWCARCHDELNSTNFKAHWPQYVNKIYHGGDLTSAETAALELGIDISESPPAH